MHKKLNTKKELAQFKQDWDDGMIKTQNIDNVFSNHRDNILGNKFIKFLIQEDSFLLLNIVDCIGKLALEDSFGKHDLTVTGNRKYYNYVLEHNGLTFIAPIKREVVSIKPEPSDFIANIIDFEKTFMQFSIDYIYRNKDSVEPYFLEALTDLEKCGLIKDGKIDFKFHELNLADLILVKPKWMK